jgi:3-dehydroquinate synthase
MDPEVLRSLPLEELRNGLAEAVKHAAILDADHFAWLGASVRDILAREPATIESLLRRNVGIKASVVQADEREGGRRAILNAGHTIGHAVEHASGFSLSHGEAVAIGLVSEARLGERLGVTEVGTAERLESLFEGFGLPVRAPRALDAEAIVSGLRLDKKNRANEIRVVLLSSIGAVNGSESHGWTVAVPESLLRESLNR